MSKKGDINTTLRLQGEKEYSQGMKNAAANVKELDSQLKKARAEFEKTGDAQKYNAEQTDILKQKIEEQQKAVKAAEDAIKLLTDNGIDKNDSRLRNWRISLNNATATLNKLEAELKKTESNAESAADGIHSQATALKSGEVAAEGYADKLDRIDKNISFQTTREKLTIVRDLIKEVLSGVLDVGKGIWNYEMQAAQWATEINKEAAEAGLDPAVYQSYKYAAMMLGMSIQDYADMAKELEASMMSTDESVAEAFNELGVAYRNEDGTLRNAMEVLAEVANALDSVNTQTASNVLASRLLGSEYKKLNPLINAGGDAWKHYIKEGKEIGAVSKAALDALLELDKSRIKLSTQFQTIKTETAGQLAPGFTAITEGVSGLLTQFDEFLKSEKGQKVVEKINGFLTTIGDTIGNVDVGNAVDNFFKKFESVDLGKAIDKVATAVSSFTDGLTWIVDHNEEVGNALTAIAAGYAGIKIGSGVLDFLKLIISLKGKGTSGVGGAAGGVIGGAGEIVGGVVEGAGEIIGDKLGGIAEKADTISDLVTDLGGGQEIDLSIFDPVIEVFKSIQTEADNGISAIDDLILKFNEMPEKLTNDTDIFGGIKESAAKARTEIVLLKNAAEKAEKSLNSASKSGEALISSLEQVSSEISSKAQNAVASLETLVSSYNAVPKKLTAKTDIFSDFGKSASSASMAITLVKKAIERINDECKAAKKSIDELEKTLADFKSNENAVNALRDIADAAGAIALNGMTALDFFDGLAFSWNTLSIPQDAIYFLELLLATGGFLPESVYNALNEISKEQDMSGENGAQTKGTPAGFGGATGNGGGGRGMGGGTMYSGKREDPLSEDVEIVMYKSVLDEYVSQSIREKTGVAGIYKALQDEKKNVADAINAILAAPFTESFDQIEALAYNSGRNVALAYAQGIESMIIRVTSATARLIAASQPSGRLQNAPYLTGGAYVDGNVYIDGQLAGNVLARPINENLGIFASGR